MSEKYKQPQTLEEYNELCIKNCRIDGYGLEVVTILCCPFCAAPDWMKIPVTAGLHDYEDQQKPHLCKECGRSARMKTSRTVDSFNGRIVQTGGDDPPSFITFFLRE